MESVNYQDLITLARENCLEFHSFSEYIYKQHSIYPPQFHVNISNSKSTPCLICCYHFLYSEGQSQYDLTLEILLQWTASHSWKSQQTPYLQTNWKILEKHTCEYYNRFMTTIYTYRLIWYSLSKYEIFMFGFITITCNSAFTDRHVGQAPTPHGEPPTRAVVAHHHLSSHPNQILATVNR